MSMLLLVPVTTTTPPLTALKPVFVVESMSRPPENVIIAPFVFASLLSRLMPRPLSSIAPEKTI